MTFFLISHLLDNPYLFHKKAGAGAGQPGARSGHRQSWHGLPPQMMSTAGSLAPSSFVTSPTWIMPGKRYFVTSMGKASISLAQRGSIPARTADPVKEASHGQLHPITIPWVGEKPMD